LFFQKRVELEVYRRLLLCYGCSFPLLLFLPTYAFFAAIRSDIVVLYHSPPYGIIITIINDGSGVGKETIEHQ